METKIKFDRKKQLESIADEFEKFLKEGGQLMSSIEYTKELHRLQGYCEQLRIIAGEINYGKVSINFVEFVNRVQNDDWGFDEQQRMFERIGWERKEKDGDRFWDGFCIDTTDMESNGKIFFKVMSNGGKNDKVIADWVENYFNLNHIRHERFDVRKFYIPVDGFYKAFVKEE